MTADIFYAQGEIKQSLPKMTARTELMDAWQLLGQAMSLNNNTEISSDGKVTGEPTEVALRQGAEAAGYQSTVLKGVLPRMDEIPFDADRKRMSTIHRDRDGTVVFTKGAPESVLDRCISVWGAQGPDDVDKEQLRDQAAAMAGRGYRVLAFATRRLSKIPQKPAVETVETDLAFLGLVGLIDPPRPEVHTAIEECVPAGVTPIMITGDGESYRRAPWYRVRP